MRPPATASAPSVAERDPPFVVRLPAFEGTLAELAQALRTGRLTPRQADLLIVVREVLARFERFVAHDLERATDALPAAATVVELKARLLLPRGPRPVEEADEAEGRAQALEAVAALEALEDAIAELRERRERRRHLWPAQAPAPTYPRLPRSLGVPLTLLTELAARLRPGPYFEFVAERLTVTAAMRHILQRLRPGQRRGLDELVDDPRWATRAVHFAAALELARDGRCRLHQSAPFEPIEVEVIQPGDEPGRVDPRAIEA